MMKKMAFILPCLLLFLGCERTKTQPETIVVEGWIEDGKHPVVLLHRAAQLTDKEIGTDEMVKQSLIYTANIMVSDGADSVQLIGKIDTTMLPPYYYHNVRITGQTGKSYTLTVNYYGQKLTAVTTIPSIVPIDSVSVSSINGKDKKKEVIVHFKDNAATADYYALFYRTGQKRQYVLASLGIRDDSAQQGQSIEWRLNRSYTLLDSSKDFYFSAGDTVLVKLSHLDADSYTFWTSFASTSEANTWIFMPKAQISTNIEGGLGYWCGYGSDEKQLIIPESDTTFVYTDE
ncbi:MAG: DUF4249 domain-containing protein [Paludibacteraceae bacterium]|nr:DUF4249 domain-containing protein [Paludibacteraceae bacterium]